MCFFWLQVPCAGVINLKYVSLVVSKHDRYTDTGTIYHVSVRSQEGENSSSSTDHRCSEDSGTRGQRLNFLQPQVELFNPSRFELFNPRLSRVFHFFMG